jgi:hypothetical protein
MADYTKPTGVQGRPPVPTEKKKVEKVVNGKVKTKKKNGVTKFADVFLAEDVNNVKSYLVGDVIIPTLKKAFYDLITKGAGMFIYGDSRGGRNDSRTGDSVSYRNYSDYSRNDRRYTSTARPVSGYSYEDLVFESFDEADRVLTQLDAIMQEYHVVSVAELYESAGMAANYTDHYYGWTDIHTANVVPDKEGWVIRMPKATSIKNMK